MTRRGFTLVELLVTIAIVGLLIAIVAAAVASSRATARRLQCINNMRQTSLAVMNFTERTQAFPIAPSMQRPFAVFADELGVGEIGDPATTPEVLTCPDDSYLRADDFDDEPRGLLGR